MSGSRVSRLLAGLLATWLAAATPIASAQDDPKPDEPRNAETETTEQASDEQTPGDDGKSDDDQATTDQASEAESGTPAWVDATYAEVAKRIESISAREDKDDFTDEDKARLEAYREAYNFLSEAKANDSQERKFRGDTDSAPETLETTRAELAKPTTPLSPDPPADATVAQLQAGLDKANADLQSAKNSVATILSETDRRDSRQPEIRAKIAGDHDRLQTVTGQLAALPLPDESAALTDARRYHYESEIAMLTARIAALRAEQAYYDAIVELLPLRRELAARRATQIERLAADWQRLVETQRAAEIQRQQAEAKRAAALAHPLVAPIADDNARLAGRRDELRPEIEAIQQEAGALPDPKDLVEQLDSLKNRVEIGGLTSTVGLSLRKVASELPDAATYRRNIRARRTVISEIGFEHAGVKDDLRRAQRRQEKDVDALMAQLGPDVPDSERDAIEQEAREQLRIRRGYLKSLSGDLDTYFHALISINETENEIVEASEATASYIRERILWIRSANPLRARDVPEAGKAIAWMVSSSEWAPVVEAMSSRSGAWWVPIAVTLVAVGVLMGVRHNLRGRVKQTADDLARASTDTFGRTMIAAGLTLVLAGMWPLALFVLGRMLLLADPDGVIEMAQVMGRALTGGAELLFVLLLTLEICQPKGLGEAHFRWRPQNTAVARRNLRLLAATLVPLAMLTVIMEIQSNEAYRSTAGRLAFIPAMIALSVFMQRMLSPRKGIVSDYLHRRRGGWIDRLTYIWYPLAIAFPLLLALQSAVGFHYTAVRLAGQTIETGYFLIGVVIVNGLLMRSLVVAQRRMALAEARKRREAYEERLAREEEAGDIPPLPDDATVDVSAISAQARQMIRTVTIFAILAGFWAIWADALPAIGFLKGVELWQGDPNLAIVDPVTGDSIVPMINLEDLLLGVIILVVTMIVAKNIPGLLEITILQRLPLEHGSRYAITTVLRYAITIFGVIVAFGYIGVTWAKVQFLAAAITVGLGFGLQEIFANFVSGLIILLERPIRVGDTVTVGTISGKVTRIRMRSTSIVDWDRKEMVIPNKDFVTGTIMNWTLSDPILRIIFSVGIAYGSDTKLAEKLLLKVAGEHPNVLKDPGPSVLFNAFGDSSLDFQLRLFVGNVDHLIRVKHEVYSAIDEAFREANIEIAFPQRDIHVKPVSGKDSEELSEALAETE